MRQDDVNGARCRSDGVFYAMATGFVESAIMNHDGDQHVVSVILLSDAQATIHISMKPVDDTLFNQLIDLREWSTSRPNGEVDYVRGLKAARQLMQKSRSDCRFNICIIASDTTLSIDKESQISSREDFRRTVKSMAPEFSSRLAIHVVGIGCESDSFSLLQILIEAAKSCGMSSSFRRCDLEVHLLSMMLSSLGSSADKSSTLQTSCVRLETKPKTVSKAYMWNLDVNDFTSLVDRRCQACYAMVGDETLQADPLLGWKCASCQACFFCVDCMDQFTWHLGSQQCIDLVSEHATISHQTIPSYVVSLQNGAPILSLAFDGRELQFLDLNAQPLEPRFAGKDLGASDFRRIGAALKAECRRLCHDRAIVVPFAETFNAALDKYDSSYMYPRLRFAKSFIIDIEGESCFLLSERAPSHTSKKEDYNVVCQGEVLDALSHFVYAKSDGNFLAVATIKDSHVARGGGLGQAELFVTRVLLYTKQNKSTANNNWQAVSDDLFPYLQTHSCNELCGALNLSMDKS